VKPKLIMEVAVLTHAMRVRSCASQVRSNAMRVESSPEVMLSGWISPLVIFQVPNSGRALDSYLFKSLSRERATKSLHRTKAAICDGNRAVATFGHQFEFGDEQ
jgi:hypothetical protein